MKVTIQMKNMEQKLPVTDINYGKHIVRYGKAHIARLGRRAYEGGRRDKTNNQPKCVPRE